MFSNRYPFVTSAHLSIKKHLYLYSKNYLCRESTIPVPTIRIRDFDKKVSAYIKGNAYFCNT